MKLNVQRIIVIPTYWTVVKGTFINNEKIINE